MMESERFDLRGPSWTDPQHYIAPYRIYPRQYVHEPCLVAKYMKSHPFIFYLNVGILTTLDPARVVDFHCIIFLCGTDEIIFPLVNIMLHKFFEHREEQILIVS